MVLPIDCPTGLQALGTRGGDVTARGATPVARRGEAAAENRRARQCSAGAKTGLLIDTRSEGVQDMHEPSQVGDRGTDADGTAGVGQGGGPLDTQVTRAAFLAGAGKLGIGALTLGALGATAPGALGALRSSESVKASNQTIAMIENA